MTSTTTLMGFSPMRSSVWRSHLGLSPTLRPRMMSPWKRGQSVLGTSTETGRGQLPASGEALSSGSWALTLVPVCCVR